MFKAAMFFTGKVLEILWDRYQGFPSCFISQRPLDMKCFLEVNNLDFKLIFK